MGGGKFLHDYINRSMKKLNRDNGGEILTNHPFLREFLPYNDRLINVLDLTFKEEKVKNKDVLYVLRGYYILVNFLVDEKNVFNQMPEGYKTLLSKGSLDLLATYSTLSSGCMNQSLSLVRSLFESSVYLTYVNRDFEKRIKLYENYKHFASYYKWKDNKELFNLPPEKEEEIRKNYALIKNDYSRHGSWYEKPLLEDMEGHSAFNHIRKKRATFKAMCIITGQEEMYSRLYSTMSESVHGSSLIGGLFINEKDNISMAPKFDLFYIKTLSAFSILFLNSMVEIGLSRQIENGHTEYKSYLDYSRRYADILLKEGVPE